MSADECRCGMTDPMAQACETCGVPQPIVEESEEQIGFEEQAREVHLTRFACGHEIVRPVRRATGGLS